MKAFSVGGGRLTWTGLLSGLQIGSETFTELPIILVQNSVAGEGRFEDGLLPTRLFRSVDFNNRASFVIFNRRLAR